jgi:hypothetical protein
MSQYVFADASFEEALDTYIDRAAPISINGAEYSVYPRVLTGGTLNGNVSMMTLIVPDDVAARTAPASSALCFNCAGDPWPRRTSSWKAWPLRATTAC